ncbi:NAD-dependent succinate-semialdehyde dehydrogenase [Geodermatophilus sabuli]|uniref:Succinate-semialdehyde dehydrogenase / glutarate-semialdehyde dehydrogenase n=1 Tax=Geodermatophilus sabuli TaxID=1564158 RepID=A0A285E6C4_9ACTN|nr:NAD-dependent succinate-semialdehyde dehydrogenase [Geodermatophilus sabuli]MBB3082472.1 succinate-semialdehyde dehydrogenase/glutarate-semialdehyde dehydrogenase [Geodermatophilus sabuli]SNX94658.1 succinate-semialdehyde dehydrogenase / glutarate-semialdehyde dehydrogenase [Geodermatophilus sabuli]
MGLYTTTNPATGETLATYEEISDAELQDLIARSDAAYRSWRTTSPDERRAVLSRAAEIHRERSEELAALLTLEMGKPAAQAQGEVALVASIYQYYADHVEEFLADEPLEISGPGTAVVRTEPIGPLVGVMPWNYPYYQVARFAAPNIALGNTVILKHARNCPQSALVVERVLTEAGLPDGVYLNAFISSAQVADAIADPRVQGVSLTGSEKAGAAVAEVAGRNLKKCVLELGGSDPVIVLDDADIDAAAAAAATGRLANGGQACTASKRFLVQAGVYDEFVRRLVDQMAGWTPDDPTSTDTKMGPLSSASAAGELDELVEDAVSQGAELLLGGGRTGEESAFYRPTLLGGVTSRMRAYSEELFGPAGVVYRFDSIEDAIELANDSPYGLSSSVFTSDDEKAQQIAESLETGMVWINSTSRSAPDLPFGGVKRSGFGRELARFGFNEFANKKLVRNARAGS